MAVKLQKSALQDLVYLFPLAAFFLLFQLGRGSLASWDEALYASVARDIFRTGDWLNLSIGGHAWTDKPPLAFWATAFFYKAFGVNEFSARLFSALCGLGTVVVTYFLGAKLLGRWTGFLGALVLLSSSHFLHFARFGMLDVPLTFFLSLALYFFWLGREKNRYLIFSGIVIGLAVMTKGFAAFLIFPVVWLYCWWAGESEILGRSSYWIGVMLAVLIALPWNLYQLTNNREAFMHDVVIKHLFSRTTRALEGHHGNFYFYIRTLVNKYHPWILVGILSAPYFLLKSIRERREEFIFLSVWMFFIFGAITLVQTKLQWYVLPIYPPLSLSVGYALAKVFKENQKLFIRVAFIVIMALHVPYSHIFNHDYSRDIKGIAPIAKQLVPTEATVYLCDYHEAPATSFYLDRRNAYLDGEQALLEAARTEKPFFCLIHEARLRPVSEELRAAGLSEAGSFENLRLLVKNKS